MTDENKYFEGLYTRIGTIDCPPGWGLKGLFVCFNLLSLVCLLFVYCLSQGRHVQHAILTLTVSNSVKKNVRRVHHLVLHVRTQVLMLKKDFGDSRLLMASLSLTNVVLVHAV